MTSELNQLPAPLVAVTSLAVGSDQLLARLVLERGGAVHAVLPFADIERTFAREDISAYRTLVARADVEVSPHTGLADEDAYLAAGHRVVQLSEVLFAVWDGQASRGKGGTADIVAYALSVLVPLVHIDPVRRQVHNTARDLHS